MFLNRGDGTFRSEATIEPDESSASSNARGGDSVAIGDLNGDGKPDLVTANDGPDERLRASSPGRRQLPARSSTYGTSRHPLSVAIGDLNGDGKPDLATANGGANTVSVFLNTPGLCAVQDVKGETLPGARRKIARTNCRVGRIRRAYSRRLKKGRVISQKPKPAESCRAAARSTSSSAAGASSST